MFVQTCRNCYELPQDSFYNRVRHNFKIYVLLGLKTGEWNQQDILSKIYELRGYKSHRVIKYGTNWSHLHIKFVSAHYAFEAVKYFKQLSPNLSVELIENMLQAWYQCEKELGYEQTLTHSIVDIIGSPPRGLNFLTERVINALFIDYGSPYLLPYTAALSEKHVQLVFKSMTEALAACMAFGEWYSRDKKCDLFYYRVRINPGAYEASLIEHSKGIPEEAFKLEYFVYVKTDSKTNHKNKKNLEKCTRLLNRTKRIYKNEGNLEVNHPRKEQQQPLMCVPVCTPQFNVYGQTYMANFSTPYLPQIQANLPLGHCYYQSFNYNTRQGITHTNFGNEFDNETSTASGTESEISAENFLPEGQSWEENEVSLPNNHMAIQPEEQEPPIQPEKLPKEKHEPPILPEKLPKEKREPPIQPEKLPKEKLEPPIQPEKLPKEKREPPIQPEKLPKEKREPPIQPEKFPKENHRSSLKNHPKKR